MPPRTPRRTHRHMVLVAGVRPVCSPSHWQARGSVIGPSAFAVSRRIICHLAKSVVPWLFRRRREVPTRDASVSMFDETPRERRPARGVIPESAVAGVIVPQVFRPSFTSLVCVVFCMTRTTYGEAAEDL
jgi:hypothetical protein